MGGVHSLISTLPTFLDPVFFLCDEFHLMKNISKLCYDLISPNENQRFKINDSTEYTFDLNHSYGRSTLFFETIDTYVNNSRVTIPTSFDGNWEQAKGHNRAVDWLDFLLYIIPTLVIHQLKNREAKDALMNLVYGCSIALQWSISKSDVTKMNR